MDFDDPKPRSAPVPESFSAVPSVSSVPEVSLVFSPSPVTVTKDGRIHTKYLNIQSHISSPKDILNYETRLYETVQKEKCERRPESRNVRNIGSVNNNMPSTRKQGNIDFPYVETGLFDPEVNFSNSLPQRHIANFKMQEGIDIPCRTELSERNCQKESASEAKSSMPQNNCSPVLRNNGNCTVDGRDKVPKRSDLNIQYAALQVGQMTAMKHNHENPVAMNERSETRPSYHPRSPCENMSTVHSFHNQFTSGSQCCCTNHNLRNDVPVNSRPVLSTNVPVHVNTHCTCYFSGSGPQKNGSRFIPCVSCNSSRNLRNGNIYDCQSNERVNVPTDLMGKCTGRFEHFDKKQSDQCVRHPNEAEDQVFPGSTAKLNCVVQQNSSSIHQYSHNSRMNANSSENRGNKNKDECYSHTIDTHKEEIQREMTPSKNDNNECLLKNKLAEDQGKQYDKRSSDTSILQEIALMNQKQCNILQGLLQQVVVMQADQMKILSEINEKLSNTRLSEDTFPNRHEGTSLAVSKSENATTQTTFIEKTDSRCQKCEERNEDAAFLSIDNLSKNTPTNQIFHENNIEPNKILCTEKVMEKETGHNKSKKLQDRAVSWSAVHGIETVEESFTLHGVCVPTVVEQLPSSVHTMHLHMQDYNSSASFDSITETRHVNDSKYYENGQDNHKGSWTLYDNIVGHVKKFLQTVPCEKNGTTSQKTSQVEAIRFATIEKIRQLGVSVYENSTEIKEVNATGRIHFDSKVASHSSFYNSSPGTEKGSSDASLEIQTLAVKYLQDEDLLELAKWNQNSKTPSILKTGQRSANISLATQHYLEKYHLLPTGSDKRYVNANCGQVYTEDNILDITTLKKQPKLL